MSFQSLINRFCEMLDFNSKKPLQTQLPRNLHSLNWTFFVFFETKQTQKRFLIGEGEEERFSERLLEDIVVITEGLREVFTS